MIGYLKTSYFIVVILLLTIGVQSCGSTQAPDNKIMFEENPPFKIEKAYFQKWMAGTKEGGTGINVHLIFSTIDSGVTIQDIYFKNHILKTQNSLDNSNEYIAHLSNKSKNDVVMDIDSMKEAHNTPSQDFPFDLKDNEAVLGYMLDGKKNYFKILNISEKMPIAYPQSNQNHPN